MMEFYNRKVYSEINDALRDRKEEIRVITTMNFSNLSNVFSHALQNEPIAFDVDSFEMHGLPPFVNITPNYWMERTSASIVIAKCQKRRDEIIKKCLTSNTYDTVLAVHDMIARNVRYEDCGKESHTMLGPLIDKAGVCDGFSKAFKYVLDGLGISSFVIAGEAIDPATRLSSPHAWNIVSIDGQWTHIDLTFDATISCFSTVRHDYFGLASEDITSDHFFEEKNYPTAVNSSIDFYGKYGLTISGKKQFALFLETLLSSGQRTGTFRAINITDQIDVTEKVIELTASFLVSHGISASIAVNYNPIRSVCSVQF